MSLGVLLVGTALLAELPPGQAGPAEGVLAAYEAARTKAGNDADSHVRLALWCEAHGLPAERLKHLALAVLRDPAHPTARGLLGLVDYKGRWQRPEAVAEKVKADAARAAAVAQYLERRAKARDTADDQWKLASWCESVGLKDEATAHFRAVLRLDPTREAVWKHLGYKKFEGRWVTDARRAAEKADADLQRRADRQWRPALERIRDGLESKTKSRRDEAASALGSVSDPRAVPSVWAVFAARPDPARQVVAVQLLAQIDTPGASRALAILAVSGASAEVRRAAAETLPRRDPREFADLLIALIREPIKYDVKPVGGQGASGQISIHGKEADVKRIYTPPPVAIHQILPTDQITFDAYGLPVVLRPYKVGGVFRGGMPSLGVPRDFSEASAVFNFRNIPSNTPNVVGVNPGGVFVLPPRYQISESGVIQIPVGRMLAESERSSVAARQTLENDVASIEAYNVKAREVNDRILPVLAAVAGQDFGPDREAWGKWWVDQIGMTIFPQKSQEKTTFVEQVPIDYQPQVMPTALVQSFSARRLMSCFAAGTLVKTLDGPRPIEALEVGDVVLTQSTRDGALGYHPVLKVHRNPPSATFRVAVEDEAVVSSAFHRFWVAGKGWVMARELKPGDTVRTLGGLAKVSAVEDDRVQPVFNLDVAADADFFVGRVGALVHDNTLPDLRLTPFDAPARRGE
jgi:hypothetical protein